MRNWCATVVVNHTQSQGYSLRDASKAQVSGLCDRAFAERRVHLCFVTLCL
jgi:hypothetical protein